MATGLARMPAAPTRGRLFGEIPLAALVDFALPNAAALNKYEAVAIFCECLAKSTKRLCILKIFSRP